MLSVPARSSALLAVSLLMANTLGACASIIEGSSQDVTIQPHPQAPASCRLANDLGSWSAHPSTPVTVKRSKSDLTVQCDGPTMTGRTVNESGVEEWAFLNILLGGIIGLGVDAATGALFACDDTITVPMQAHAASAPVAQPAPAVTPAPQTQAPATFYAPAAPQAPASSYGVLRPPVMQ